MHDALPRTAAALETSPGQGLPEEPVFAAFVDDLLAAKQNDSLYNLAKDLNNLLPAARSHVLRTARGLSPEKRMTRGELIALDPFWGQSDTWSAIRSGVHPLTTSYLLAAMDLRWTTEGGSVRCRRTRRSIAPSSREPLR
jgi:putative spermidine/putrescine transport system permease protein